MERTEKSLISIIVPTRNRAHLLKSFLESLRIQDFGEDKVELLAVDNASEDDTRALIEDFAKDCRRMKVRYLYEPETGMMRARNRGIREAEGRFLIFLDDDVMLHRDYILHARKAFKDMPGTWAGGGKIIPVFERQKPPWLTKFFMPLLAEVNLGEKVREFPKNRFPFGINMVFTHDVFERFGLFPVSGEKRTEDWISLPEKKYFERLRAEGIPVYYFPDLMVWHLLPDDYVDRDYIRRQAEIHYRMKLNDAAGSRGWKKWRLLLREIPKWIGVSGVAVYYLLSTQWEKIKPLYRYRYWVTRLLWRCLTGREIC